MSIIKKKYHVYLLKSETTKRTYVGYSIDPLQRLRKHNGEIKGGAKYTRCGRPWKLIMYVTGFEFERTALQYEWRIHHPPQFLKKKGAHGVINRLRIMKGILQMEKIVKNARPISEINLEIIWIDSLYQKYWI